MKECKIRYDQRSQRNEADQLRTPSSFASTSKNPIYETGMMMMMVEKRQQVHRNSMVLQFEQTCQKNCVPLEVRNILLCMQQCHAHVVIVL